MQLMQKKIRLSNRVLTNERFFPQKWRAFSQAIYIPYIEPQTVLSAGYPPRQIKNLLITGKPQRKGVYTKILLELEVDFLSVFFY